MIPQKRVSEIFIHCLYKEDEIKDDVPIVEPIYIDGIFVKFGLHPGRIKASTKEIAGFINQLPKEFETGWPFFNLCMTEAGELWTGEHLACEQLMVLGIATQNMQYCIPKEMWQTLPGGVPYVRIIKDTKEV